MIRCNTCKKEKDENDFHNCKRYKNGKQLACKICQKERHRKTYLERCNQSKIKIEKKICSICKIEKLPIEFYPGKNQLDGLRRECINCKKEWSSTEKARTSRNKALRNYYKNNPNKYREKMLRQKYKMTIKDFDNLLVIQNNCCKICNVNNSESVLVIDHCHTTGKIRGLLCQMCNKGLGHFRDNPDTMENAIKYLKN